MSIEQQRKAFDEWYGIKPKGWVEVVKYNAAWKAWLAAQQQEGYVVVPINPSEAMHQAGQDMVTFGGGYDDIYGAMIEASRE